MILILKSCFLSDLCWALSDETEEMRTDYVFVMTARNKELPVPCQHNIGSSVEFGAGIIHWSELSFSENGGKCRKCLKQKNFVKMEHYWLRPFKKVTTRVAGEI